jgi:hypothetical protein
VELGSGYDLSDEPRQLARLDGRLAIGSVYTFSVETESRLGISKSAVSDRRRQPAKNETKGLIWTDQIKEEKFPSKIGRR